MSARRTSTDLALIAGFAALIAVCALLPAIKVGAGVVPITLQTFAVLLAGAVLGARRGFLAVVLYLVVGRGGAARSSPAAPAGSAVLAGPTAGYLLGFPLAAGLCGFLVERLPRAKVATSVPLIFLCGVVSSALCIHTLGMAGLVLRADLTWARGVRHRQGVLARRHAQEPRHGPGRHRRPPRLPRPAGPEPHRRGARPGQPHPCVSRLELRDVTVRAADHRG